MIINQKGNQIVNIKYRDEKSLQEIIFQHPELLSDGEEALYSIKRELNTGAGPVDALMISDTGDVIVVEVKLGRNGQSRREVVAQIIDYISTFSQYSYHELDDLCKNELSHIVDNNERAAELSKIIDEKLRRGAINLVIAVDEVNDDLRRIMDFLSEHSDFNVSLVEVKQYKNLDDSIFYASNIVTKSKNKIISRTNGDLNRDMEYVCGQWNKLHPDMPTIGSGNRFRQIKMPKWPGNVHYEFFNTQDSSKFYVRLDNEINSEMKACENVSNALLKFDNYRLENNYVVKVIRNQKNDKIMRVRVSVDVKQIDDVIKVMDLLIRLTKDEIDEVFLREN